MNLTEAEGKALFREYGIPTPQGTVISSTKEIPAALKKITTSHVIIKAQVTSGGRGKAGGVVSAYKNKRDAVDYAVSTMLASTIKGCKVQQVLLENALDIKQELYLSMAIDRAARSYVLVFSKKGGVDIEGLAATATKTIVNLPFVKLTDPILHKAFRNLAYQTQLSAIAKKMERLLKEKDALLVEINPLALTCTGKRAAPRLVAADAKIVIDDNALYRQPWISEEKGLTPLEQDAKQHGLHYVEMDGTIAVIGNGAGMVMATLDMISSFGGKPANFLDLRGGTGEKTMKDAMRICLAKKGVKGLLITIFAGITHCDEIAKGIADSSKKRKINIPIVVRMIGTNQKEGRRILEKMNIHTLDSTEEAVKKIVGLVKK